MAATLNNKYCIKIVHNDNCFEDSSIADNHIDLVSVRLALADVTTLIQMVQRCQFTLAAKFHATDNVTFRNMHNNLSDMMNTYLKRSRELQKMYEIGIRQNILLPEAFNSGYSDAVEVGDGSNVGSGSEN